MSRQTRFTFMPAAHLGEQKKDDNGSYCSFSPKTGFLTFSKKNPDIEKYMDTWIKLYVDRSKCTLAWKFLDHEPRENMTDYTKIKVIPMGKASQVKLYVPKKVSDALGVLKDMDYSGLRIEQYTASLLDPVPFNYVVLEAKIPKDKKQKAL